MSNPPDLDYLAEQFRRFGIHVITSPLYQRLANVVAADHDLLQIAAQGRQHPYPNLFFAAVHYLLMAEPEAELAHYYPSLTDQPDPSDPSLALRRFCLSHADVLTEIVRSRLVQTNEVGRCATQLPAFGLVAALGGDRPLAMIEVGSSAGLNLNWDRYGYSYSDGRARGDPAARLQLRCELRGEPAPLPATLPMVSYRIGLDLNPLAVSNADDLRWLDALIWPEHEERRQSLRRAAAIAADYPPRIIAGDALHTLPAALAAAPADATLLLYESHTLNQWPAEARSRLNALLTDHSRQRDLYFVSTEQRARAEQTSIELTSYWAGAVSTRRLAYCQEHGQWLAWLEGCG